MTDESSVTSQTEYDDYGNSVLKVDQAGDETRFEYDTATHTYATKKTDAENNITPTLTITGLVWCSQKQTQIKK